MPRISIDDSHTNVIPPVEPVVVGRDPAFPNELTTDEELKKKSGSAVFTAFCAYPKAIHFSGKHAGEEIILLLRAHLITNVRWILISFILVLVPTVILPFLVASNVFPVSVGSEIVITIFWYLGVFTYVFLNTLYWYFNVGIITDERVVDVDWNSLVHHDVALSLMSQIQDVRAERIGVLTAIFDYGHVHVQTAGTEPNIEFLNVPHPQLVVRIIQELMAKEELEHEHNP